MSWANIKELIFQERKLLDPSAIVEFPQESAFETQQSALLASYLNTKADVDEAVRTFAQTLEWPPLTPLEKFFIAGRLDFAWEVASILNTSHDGELFVSYPSPERCTTAALLEWLLVDIWPYGCGRFLKAQKWAAEQAIPQRRDALVHEETDRGASCVA